MEPTSSPDNTRPSPGLARFWQVRPEPESPPEPLPPGRPEPPETPADLLAGSLLGGFRSRPIPPLAPIASATRHPNGEADPFGLNRAAGRVPHQPATNHPPAAGRHGDPDHSGPPEDRADPGQAVQSEEPPGDSFGGFGLGGGAGRSFFGGAGAEPADESGAGDSQVGDGPADEETTAADEPVDQTPRDAGQDEDDAAEPAEPSDENGRDDMNGRAGAPGYAQTGEAGPDGAGEPAEEAPGQNPADSARPAAGWATVPGTTPPATPTSGVPVSPAYPPNPYSAADFTPDHPAGALRPVSGLPEQPEQHEQPEQPDDPATPAPVSPAQAATGQAAVQIPATRTPPDLTIDQTPEPVGYPGLPGSAEGGYGFATSGYSLGRAPEAFGVASVTPPAPPAPPAPVATPPDFRAFPPAAESLTVAVPVVRPEQTRRSASLEDAEPVRRIGRRSSMDEPVPASDQAAEELVTGRTIWDEDAARHFRAAWHEVKAEFVDDPERALTRAHDLLTDAVNELTEVLLAERDELDPLRGNGTPDTESMRMAMRGYREFLDRILSL
ncbi:hypothetical protein [Actinoplanes utahensis]|uniref:Uncharacterized protein n=1 Tax=Actinoplanes utahensis TaxID=1869 RepID=A0A0A6UQD0_ACTUT|nr:hypothetical protein [Actinoplanes utahensis]KHD77651.1 hypothetical protein MB27_09190 [Actinoplanes utahensis]GIF34653.1 hypothetical protein Aut01nite_76390 [Actinoplanes utahensis]